MWPMGSEHISLLPVSTYGLESQLDRELSHCTNMQSHDLMLAWCMKESSWNNTLLSI